VQGVDAIEHTASPFHYKADDPNELIRPAISGTRSVLVSALKYGSDVKRVVITSSCASVLDVLTEPKVFSEKDWNQSSARECEEKGRNAPQATKYRASKTLAERAAWQFVEENKDQLKFDITCINPPFVFGPVLHEVDKAENLNTSSLDWYNAVIKGAKTKEELVAGGYVIAVNNKLAQSLTLSAAIQYGMDRCSRRGQGTRSSPPEGGSWRRTPHCC
jgi:nucleoside-diphosphate-sugar epimerase